MKVLLDENLDWRLGRDFPGHEVHSVPALGWAGVQNGELLRKSVAAGFELFVTMDGNMVHQQNVAVHPIAIIALRAPSNRLEDTRPLVPTLLASFPQIKQGTVTFIPQPRG